MKTTRTLAKGLALGALTFLALFSALPAIATHLSQNPGPPTPVPPYLAPGQPTVLPPAIPQLTPQEEQTAVSIAESDPLMQQLLGASTYTTTAIIWHSSGLQKLGAAVQFDLSAPQSHRADWPYVEYDYLGKPVYPSETEHYQVDQNSQLTAFVDLHLQAVVQILPSPLAQYSP